MLRLLFDEDMDGRVVRGLRVRVAGLDAPTIQDLGMHAAPDPPVLDFAVREARYVVTRDVNTMTAAFARRLEQGDPVPGLIVVTSRVPTGRTLDRLEYVVRVGEAADFVTLPRVYLPL